MRTSQFDTDRFAMKLLGLDFPLPTHSAAMHNVLLALAATIGFGLGSWLLGSPLNREGAMALFVGLLYVMVRDGFLAVRDEKAKRYALAATGAGILIASAALVEQLTTL